MRKQILPTILAIVILLFTGCQSTPDPVVSSGDSSVQLIPRDSNVIVGKLDNGLTYYIRENAVPANRAELYLVIKAGSVLESDTDRGIAHFVEHMAFNGTRNFPKNELIDFFETAGMDFGPDLNAFTSFDETVYELHINTDKEDIIDTAFTVFEDWARYISFDEEEVIKERDVIVEEWRRSRNAGRRIAEKQFEKLLANSKYAQRLPIGIVEVIKEVTPEQLRNFYKKWYRPRQMAIVAVGDFDSQKIKEIITSRFNYPDPGEFEKPEFAIPGHEGTDYFIHQDKELTHTSFILSSTYPSRVEETLADYRKAMVQYLYLSMFNSRIQESIQNGAVTYLAGGVDSSRLISKVSRDSILAYLREDAIIEGVAELFLEMRRVKELGFLQSELDRMKEELRRSVEHMYLERDTLESNYHAGEYRDHFLYAEAIPGIEFEYKLFEELLPGITLEEVNNCGTEWLPEDNRLISLTGPEKEGMAFPSEDQLVSMFQRLSTIDLEPYVDFANKAELLYIYPPPGAIVEENYIEDIDVTEWTLSNGIKVIYKSTDFNNNEIRMQAFSPGGHSQYGDDHYLSALTATSIIEESGLGDFSAADLAKKLAGKNLYISPWISELHEGFSGAYVPDDEETFFKLLYLYFTGIRVDEEAYNRFKTRFIESRRNRLADPDAYYQDERTFLLNSEHNRSRPVSVERIETELDYQTALGIYYDRFSDAGDFTFVFVGSVDPETLKTFVENYVASLPAKGREEAGRDLGIRPPYESMSRTYRKGIEDVAKIRLYFTGELEWQDEKTVEFSLLTGIVEQRLTEILREDLGGTYTIGVDFSLAKDPYEGYVISIAFSCDPKRADSLVEAIITELDAIKAGTLDPKYLSNQKNILTRDLEESLEENSFWLASLVNSYQKGLNPSRILVREEQISSIRYENLITAVNEYFNMERYIKTFLLPESETESGE